MASDDRPSDDLKPRRRGKAPTITLEAQEIAATPETETPAAPAGDTTADAPPASTPLLAPDEAVAAPVSDTPADMPADVTPLAETSSATEASPAAGSDPGDAPPADAAAVDGAVPPVTGGAEPEPVPPVMGEPPAAETPPPDPVPHAAPSREDAPAGPGFGRLVAAGLVGALLTGGLAAGAQVAGYWPGGPRQDTAALEQRLAALDAQLRQVAARPAATTPSAAAPAVDLAPVTRRIETLDQARAALETRIAALEQRPVPTGGGAPAAAPAAPPVDLAPIRTEIDALKTAVEAVAAAQTARPATPPAPAAPAIDMGDVDRRIAAAVSPQSNRIAEIAGSVQMLQAEVKAAAAAGATVGEKVAALEAARTEAGDAGRRAALVVGLGALRAAVDRGQPYAAELKAAQALGLPAPASEALAPHAERGLATTGALAQRFSALSPALMRAAPGPAAEGTLLERLTASAQSLVRIRPVGEAAGDDVPTVIARVEAKLRRGDLAGALSDFDRLPEPVRALGADWAAEARARAAAETSLRRLSAEAAGALSGG
jgi:hypothetical protein